MRQPSTPRWLLWLACGLLLALSLSVAMGPTRQGWEDPDTYMRLAQLDESLPLWHLPGGLFTRDNAPFGMHSHWSMPFNAVVALLSAPVAALHGWHAGLDAVQYVSGPLSLLAIAASVAWLCAALGLSACAPWSIALLAFNPSILGYGLVGRINHHLWTVAIGTAALAAALRMVRNPSRRTGVLAAAWIALAAWQSMETVPAVFAACGVIALGGAIRRTGSALPTFAITLPLLAVLILVVDGPWPGFGSLATDRFSLFHASMLCGLSVSILLAHRAAGDGCLWIRARRGCSAAAAVMIVWAAIVVPASRSGSYEPAFDAYFWNQISEVSAVWVQEDPLAAAPVALFPALPALVILGALCWRRRHRPQLVGLLTASAILAAHTLIGCMFLRASPYGAVLGAIVVGAAVRKGAARLLATSGENAPTRVLGITLFAGTAITLLATLAISRDPLVPGQCDIPPAVAETISAALPRNAIVAADIWLSPQVLWRTGLRTVAGPYHSNREGVAELGRFMMEPDGPATAAMVADRGIAAVLACGEAGYIHLPIFSEQSLARRLGSGDTPSWLKEVHLSGAVDLRFYLVRPPH